jgi:polyhydroxyalkanoate synthesis regulator phasin
MATSKKRGDVYHGGSRATDPERLYKYLKIANYQEFQPTPNLIYAHAIETKTIKAEYSRLRAIANKRLDRMAGRPEAEGTIQQHPDRFPSVRGMDRAAAVHALIDVDRFLRAGRGSLSGIKESNKKIKKSLEKKGIKVKPDQLAKFGTFMNAMKKALGINRGDYGSDQLASLWDELFQQGKISQTTFEKRVKKLMKELEEEDEKKYTRKQRQAVNEALRDHPMSDYFEDVALDPRTAAAAERKRTGKKTRSADAADRARKARRRAQVKQRTRR